MLKRIRNIFHHTLLNRLGARLEFYTVQKKAGERMLSYINSVHHLWSVLKLMIVDTDSIEMTMATLVGLPRQYNNIITALHALHWRIKVPCSLLKIRKAAFYRTNSDETWKDLWRKQNRNFWAVTATQLKGCLNANTANAGGFRRTLLGQVLLKRNQTTFK